MIFTIGATSQSIDIQIVDDQGLPVTGLTAATFPAMTFSCGGPNADITVLILDLATVTSPYSNGGVKHRGEGVYRVDLPPQLFLAQGKYKLRGEETDKRIICPIIEVSMAATLAEADMSIDTSTTPWEVVYKVRNSSTELMRKRLFSVDGDALVSTNTVVGQSIQ